MMIIDSTKLTLHRSRSFRLSPEKSITNLDEALSFVNDRGFIFFWPITGMDLPSLWTAVAGNRPVADEHDDPGHITWSWKDNALDKRIWYYAKILRRKATFISLSVVPYFYALSENYGSPEEDHIIAYESGHLTLPAKQIYDALLDHGSLNTIDLRKEAHLLNAKETVFNRALDDLQKDFKILPIGIAQVGAWRYAYRYDLTSRHFPELMELARTIGEADARCKLVGTYMDSVGSCQTRDIVKIFGWSIELVNRTIASLLAEGNITEVAHPQKSGEWLSLTELVKK